MDKYKKLAMIMCSIGLMFLLTGVTYAYFNYTKVTSSQNLLVGDIHFNLSEGDDEIELTNIFPESASEARSRDDNYITFSISGINTSNKPIYYEFVLNYGETLASPKSRYKDEDLRFDLVELDVNGNELEYLVDALSYSSIVNKRIWVDTVDANTNQELNRYYKLRVWLDEDVIISESDPNADYTTQDYPNKYATVKLIAKGDLQEKSIYPKLYEIVSENGVLDNENSDYVNNGTPGIDFTQISSDTNGKGKYIVASTENDTYPITYYRGAVEDNNVLFADKCWKAVRTTDTGGVKLVYNGVKSKNKVALSENEYTLIQTSDFTFNSTTNTYDATYTSNVGNSNNRKVVSFNLPTNNKYYLKINKSSQNTYVSGDVFKDGVSLGSISLNPTASSDVILLNNISGTDMIQFKYYATISNGQSTTISFQVLKEDPNADYGCYNVNEETIISKSAYNNNFDSLAYAGYMYGTVYEEKVMDTADTFKFGSSFTYNNGVYTLVNPTDNPGNSKHYTCFNSSGICDGTASGKIYYVYYLFSAAGSNNYYYIELQNGKSVTDALNEMLSDNTTNSNIKTQIDTWYSNNLTSYTDKIEDTIYCNDRTFYGNNGWDVNGNLDGSILFSPYGRLAYTFQPSLACTNKSDSFTWQNPSGNKKLTYPVGLLTSDEIVFAGANENDYNVSFYLRNRENYWTMSPYNGEFNTATVHYLSDYGNLTYYYTAVDITNGIRPAISVKNTTKVLSGSGIATDPYVVD